MDLIKMGKFIAELRKEKKLTQEELGEKLGVTNKTISRWENGNYLPSVEIMQLLGEIFAISINELLCGEKIVDNNYRQKADETIINVMKSNTFSIKEQYYFWKIKWLKEHRAFILLCYIFFFLTVGVGIYINKPIILGIDSIVAIGVYLKSRNNMMAYIEYHVYDVPRH